MLKEVDMTKLAKPIRLSKDREPGTLHSFFALKYHEGDQDKLKIESIEQALNKAGITITVIARDVEKWGQASIPSNKNMMIDYAFPAMQQCDCNIIEFSEKGVGLGINAGYCYAIGKPIFIIAKTGSEISTTISNLATDIIFYTTPEDLIEPFKQIVKDFNMFKVNRNLKNTKRLYQRYKKQAKQSKSLVILQIQFPVTFVI